MYFQGLLDELTFNKYITNFRKLSVFTTFKYYSLTSLLNHHYYIIKKVIMFYIFILSCSRNEQFIYCVFWLLDLLYRESEFLLGYRRR